MSDTQVINVPFEVHKARAFEEARAEAAKLGMDTTVAGGAYVVNGVRVDANGQPVKDEPKADAKKGDR